MRRSLGIMEGERFLGTFAGFTGCSVMGVNVDRSRSIISAMIVGRKVTAMDVAWLRREVFAEGVVSQEAAEELFSVERADVEKAPEWTDFFVEMITDYALWQNRPTGVLNEAQAEWLLAQADSCMSVNALAALVNVLGEAHRAPRWFLAAMRARAHREWKGFERIVAEPPRLALVG
jgi:hypothetical protein